MPMIVTLLFVTIIGINAISGECDTLIFQGKGIITGWGIPMIENPTVGVLINGIVILLIASIITIFTSLFKMVKEKTLLPLLFFLLFQLLTPQTINSFNPAYITTLIAMLLVGALYTCYQNNQAVEKGFLIGIIISATSFIDAHILYLIPILIVGFVQMQASSLRTYAAMLVGLITPYWIIGGLGLIELSQIDFTVLAISPQMPSMSIYTLPVAIVMLMGFVIGIGNMYNALNEKIYTRATNGFINILSTYIAILLIIDNVHCWQYWPLLNGCVALQASYFFSTHTKRTSILTFYILTTLILAWVCWMQWGNYPLL